MTKYDQPDCTLLIEPIQKNVEEITNELNKTSIGFNHTKTYSIGKQNSLTTQNEALPKHNGDLCVKTAAFFQTEIIRFIA